MNLHWAYNVHKAENVDPDLPPILVFHGLFDCKENWAELAQSISEKLNREVYVFDLPNHGDSKTLSYSDYSLLVEEAKEILIQFDRPVILMGHNLGGILSILLGTEMEELVCKIVLIDVSPVDIPLRVDDEITAVIRIMREALLSLPPQISFNNAKEKVDQFFKTKIKQQFLRKMLLQSFAKVEDEFTWKINLNELESSGVNKSLTNCYPLRCLCYTDTLLIYAGQSNYVVPSKDLKIAFPNLTMQCISDSDHHIHMEKPEKLLNEMIKYFSK
ncbi:protein ABHD11-like isoform X2 [Centruroides sculpturatus]|nr:protein ABHD11-like [Centruroides sculpturatus]XP_023227185.1 protein ABHD11-like isoform X2 [Centruroides sculpturatus]